MTHKRLALALLALGTGAAVLALGQLHAALYHYDYGGSFRFGWSAAYVVALIASAYGVGLPDLPQDRRGRLIVGASAVLIAAGMVSVIQLFVGDTLLPRFVVLGSALVLIPGYVGCAALCGKQVSRAQRGSRVVVIGDPSEAKELGEELLHKPERPACLVDIVEVEEAHAHARQGQLLTERVLGENASVLVLSREAQLDDAVISEAANIHSSGVRVRTLLSFYEEWLGRIPIVELERMSLMFDIGEIHRRHYLRVKRLVDFTFGIVGLLALGLLLPIVVLGNLVGSPGPLFYRQDRIGKNGFPFVLIKFRTMRNDGSASTNEWTRRNDLRITPFGQILRRTHLDELPQVVNILRGDLSIVGPRPEQPHYVRWLIDTIPFYDMRHMVRPGVTGWAQVNYPYGGDEHDALGKLQYDFYYLRHQGLTLDIRVIVRTLRSIMGLTGR